MTKVATPPIEKPKQSLEQLKARLKKARLELNTMDAQLEDPLGYAQGIIDKLYEGFPKGKAFLDRCVESVVEKYWLISPIGRRRNLWRVITERNKFLSDAGRRAKNSPIQGIASEVGVTSGFLVLKHYLKYMQAFDIPNKYFPKYQRAVHDANYYSVPYQLVIPGMFIKQYVATYGTAEHYKEVFGWKFNIEPEIELEICAREDEVYKWDWQVTQGLKLKDPKKDDQSLGAIIEKSVDDQIALGVLPAEQRAKVLKTIFAPLADEAKRKFLLDNYPLLNVRSKIIDQRLQELAAKYVG